MDAIAIIEVPDMDVTYSTADIGFSIGINF
jgi:hypothetical protein